MTISPEYLEQQKLLHQDQDYGIASLDFVLLVIDMVDQLGAKSITDYGAGKCNLEKKMIELGQSDFQYYPYDPAFPEYGEPREADLVCCIDVLEHIEPPYLEAVLEELARITIKVGLFTIFTGPALKNLPDGRNAHLIQQPASWWLPRNCGHFEIVQMQRLKGVFWVVVEPLSPARQESL